MHRRNRRLNKVLCVGGDRSSRKVRSNMSQPDRAVVVGRERGEPGGERAVAAGSWQSARRVRRKLGTAEARVVSLKHGQRRGLSE